MSFPKTIDLGDNGGVIRLRNPAEARALVDAEIDLLNSIRQSAQQAHHQGGANRLNSMIEAVDQKNGRLHRIAQLLDNGRSDEALLELPGELAPGKFPTTKSVRGAAILDIRERLGPMAAVGAFAAFTDLRFDSDNPTMLRGYLAADQLVHATGNQARRSVQTGLAQVIGRAGEQQRRLDELIEELETRLADVRVDHRRRVAMTLRGARRGRRRVAAEFHDRADAAISELDHTRQVYIEHMALKGPVKYWQDKASEHRKKARWARNIGLAFAAILTAYIVADGGTRVLGLVERAIVRTGQWQVAYVVLTAALLVLTIAFWIGRLISRTYVSESHLAIDADERATMVQTYLALANENKISENERVLVLAALFRASSDGLVKDDAAPDLSLAGVASRLAAGGSPNRPP